MERKLAAIQISDIVGYTKLMEADTEGTVAAWSDARDNVIEPKLEAADGRLVKFMGDGFLAEFSTVQNALECAIEIQSGVKNNSLKFRMAVHLGDIIDDGKDIYGEGINIAARLEGIAEPGGICISGDVYNQVRNRIPADYEDIGPQEVKNVANPIQAYTVKYEKIAQDNVKGGNVRLAEIPSIAVLPFDNMSGDPEQEYFSDGMSEDLITDLSKIPDLYVSARNSSFSFKGQRSDVREVAEKLDVSFVLEGSVRKMGDRLRINAQLINGVDGGHLWAERYDGMMSEIFEFQDRITSEIVKALELKLTGKSVTGRNLTADVNAYDLFLKGRDSYYRLNQDDVQKARGYLEQAIQIDPSFSEAYSFLSYCYFQGWTHMWSGWIDSLDRAREYATKAVDLDNSSATALSRLAWIQIYFKDFERGLTNIEKAAKINPNNGEVLFLFGAILNYLGEAERALRTLEDALRVDSFVSPSWDVHVGLANILISKFEDALTALDRSIQRAPEYYPAYVFKAWAHAELDQPNESKITINLILKIIPDCSIKQMARILPFRSEDDLSRLANALRLGGLPED